MKMLMVLMMLALMTGTLRAQEAHYAFAAHPYVTRGDLAASRFWTRGTIALVALDGAAKATDSYYAPEHRRWWRRIQSNGTSVCAYDSGSGCIYRGVVRS